jgi:cytochrome c oxidase subunit 3
MSFFRTLKSRPWQSTPGQAAELDLFNGQTFDREVEKIGLRIFCVVVSVLFLLFIVSYRMRMLYPDWRPAPEPLLLWVNTGLLVLSSVASQWAVSQARNGNLDKAKITFGLGGILAIAFVVGQLWCWQQFYELGLFVSTNPAYGFFYMITAAHGIHILGGLAAWFRALWQMNSSTARDIVLSIELCTVYWHFLLVVWVILFYMLLST